MIFKIKFSILNIFAFYICICCCVNVKKPNNINNENELVMHVDISKVKVFDLNDFRNEYISTINYIHLETTDESLIGEIEKVYLHENNIIIFDKKTERILLFNQDGKFIRQIGKRGQGPDEYNILNDIYFDDLSGLIYAHERIYNTIFIYNLEGIIVEKIKPNFRFNSFCKTKDGFWLYTCFKYNNPNGYNLMLVDLSMKTMLGGYFQQHPNFVNVEFKTRFRLDSEGISYFTYPTSNCIFKLDSVTPVVSYKIDFGNKTAPYEKLANLDSSEEYEKLMENDYFKLGDCTFWNNIFIFSFSESSLYKPRPLFTAHYNKKESKLDIYRGYKNTKEMPTNNIVSVSGKALIYSIFPFELDADHLEYIDKQIDKKLDEEDNPILIICYPKIQNLY